jgi:hypothetical protein
MVEQPNVKVAPAKPPAAEPTLGNGAPPRASEDIDPATLLAALRASDPDEFRVARVLLDLIERSALKMRVVDRIHLARLTYSAAAAIEQAARKERAT